MASSVLKKLRLAMKNTNYVSQHLNAYIIPSCDAHQSEYIAPKDQRREYVSRFTGSNGTAIVTEQHAALWTDGRYFLQAEQELDGNWTLMRDGEPGTPTFDQWLGKVLPSDSLVGVDPFLLSFNTWKTLSKSLKSFGHKLEPVSMNLVDVIWEGTFHSEPKTIESHPVEYAGQSWQEKISKVRQEMDKEKASILILSFLDEIAWLFNLRGSDIPFNPVFFSYAIITMDTAYLFLEVESLSPLAKASLLNGGNSNLQLLPYESIIETIENLINGNSDGRVWISGLASYALVSRVPKEQRLVKDSPIAMHKAIKNEVEIASARTGHIRDAVALCEFFCWLSHNIGSAKITELDAAAKLDEFRGLQKDFVGNSFETISSSGPNAAIIHYKPTEKSNRLLSIDEVYLCDSGGQYRDGCTTDVTRTFHFGNPSPLQKKINTLVLKGHIAMSMAIFPKDTRGFSLDSFARKALWEHGYNYPHGTGHGVGSYLNVHEGPMRISHRPSDSPGLQAGMIVSNEPGCYLEGQYGFRAENLVLIKSVQASDEFGNDNFLAFEPLTLVPFQTKLIEPSMLTTKEQIHIKYDMNHIDYSDSEDESDDPVPKIERSSSSIDEGDVSNTPDEDSSPDVLDDCEEECSVEPWRDFSSYRDPYDPLH